MTKRIFLPSNFAEHWEASPGLPREIGVVFEQASLGPAELLAAFPEWKTPLPGGKRESQTDILALVGTAQGLWVAGAEAKVAEPFGPTVGEWLVDASPGKLERLNFLKTKLGLRGDDCSILLTRECVARGFRGICSSNGDARREADTALRRRRALTRLGARSGCDK